MGDNMSEHEEWNDPDVQAAMEGPAEPVASSSAQAHVAPKRLFAATTTLSSHVSPNIVVSPSRADSDCGSEFTRSLDDITTTLSKLETKTEKGTIRLNISSLSGLRAKMNTAFHTIANFPWRLAAKTECTKRTGHVKFFSVYIDCNPESESTLWSCDAVVEFRLISHKPEVGPFARQFTNKFNFNSNNWGFPSFMEWSEILNPEKGYIKGDRVIVEAQITVQKVIGVRTCPKFDFLSCPHGTDSDGVLVIHGNRLQVSKSYLSLYSPVFHAMFFSKFSERDKKEIVVEDVLLEEFLELLHVVYPSHKPVTHENVEYLLELGDRFEVQFVVDECERFLVGTDDISVVSKLVWADQYCLANLQDACVRTFKSYEDVKALRVAEEYKNFSNATKAALLERVFKIL